MALGGQAAGPASPLSPRAREVLAAVLESGPSVEQIHAAEVLIAFGESSRVCACLHRGGAAHEARPIYRVLRWRTLASCADHPEERQRLVDQLLAIADSTEAPDRLHAAESAAKLGLVPPPAMVRRLEAWASAAPERDSVLVYWLVWSRGLPADAEAHFTTWLASTDPITRLRAAYVLRWLRPASPALLAALASTANSSVDLSLASAGTISAAYLLRASPGDQGKWRAQLERIVDANDPGATYHALQGLMGGYRREDLDRIVPLLGHPAPDVRVAAAWTILTVEEHR